MKKLFLTTALILPLAISPTFAQQPVVPAPGPGAMQGNDTATDPATDPAADPATDSTTGAEPLAGSDAATGADAAAEDSAAVVTDPDKVVQEQAANELRLDWVTGATVTAPDGEVIGKVSDLILDHDSGSMAAAVIGVGGFLGIGEKKIAVPWDRLVIDYDANQITSDLSRAEAEAAPEYVFRLREPPPPAPIDATVAPAPIQ